MNLPQLRALLAVADQGSFTAAAGSLGLTQSAVSHAVASLERELGLPLVARDRAGARLTAHGRKVLGHAREAVHRVDRIAQDAAAAAGRHHGRLRVAVFPSAAQLLPALIADLAQHSWPPTGSSLGSSRTTHWRISPTSPSVNSSTTRSCSQTAAASHCCTSCTTPPGSPCDRPGASATQPPCWRWSMNASA